MRHKLGHSRMADYRITFDTRPYEELDSLALAACQDYNLGGAGDWFGEWRGGLYGFYARLFGVSTHYQELHAWTYGPRLPAHIEYHLATLFFNMDSALECLTFAFNALGYAVHPSRFRDVADERAQKRISPLDILGDPTRSPPLHPLSGYAQLYPQVQSLWQSQVAVINQIRDLHDASKHRRTVFVGGLSRDDPPKGFDRNMIVGLPPMAEIILKDDPKLPALKRTPKPVAKGELLEDLAPLFVKLIDDTGTLAFADTTRGVPLKQRQLRAEP
jgi:hypothetical protein